MRARTNRAGDSNTGAGKLLPYDTQDIPFWSLTPYSSPLTGLFGRWAPEQAYSSRTVAVAPAAILTS